MALCLKKFFKKVGSVSYTNLRKHVTLNECKRAPIAAAPALNEICNYNYYPSNLPSNCYLPSQTVPMVQVSSSDLILWNKSISNYDEEMLKYYLCKENLDLLANLQNEIALCAKHNMVSKKEDKVKQLENQGRPNNEQLQKVFNRLREDLPNFFSKKMDYSVYHKDLVFENNIRGTVTIGLMYYVQQISLLNFIGHLKFAYVSMDVLKITAHPEDGTVKVRWRMKGLSTFKVMATFWKVRLWNLKDNMQNAQKWYDGFSTFYINSDGLIYKHVVDKMMPDSNEETTLKTPLAAKVALILGLAPNDLMSFADACAIVEKDCKLVKHTMLPLEEIE